MIGLFLVLEALLWIVPVRLTPLFLIRGVYSRLFLYPHNLSCLHHLSRKLYNIIQIKLCTTIIFGVVFPNTLNATKNIHSINSDFYSSKRVLFAHFRYPLLFGALFTSKISFQYVHKKRNYRLFFRIQGDRVLCVLLSFVSSRPCVLYTFTINWQQHCAIVVSFCVTPFFRDRIWWPLAVYRIERTKRWNRPRNKARGWVVYCCKVFIE